MKRRAIRGLAALALAMPVHAAAGDTLADAVLGQRRLNTSLPFLVDGRVFSASDVAVDRSVTPDRIYLADVDLNRVLGWSDAARFRAGAAADLVLGQGALVTGSFVSTLDECPALYVADSAFGPSGLAVGLAGDLYVADTPNDRVLVFADPLRDDTADRLFGHFDSPPAECCSRARSTWATFRRRPRRACCARRAWFSTRWGTCMWRTGITTAC